jgi:hypothetical protein
MAKSIGELLDSEDRDLILRFVDKRVSTAVQTFQAGHPNDNDLAVRLRKLEEATDRKIQVMQLENHILRECVKMGVDFADVQELGMNFTDEADAGRKLTALSEKIKLRQVDDLNKLMLENSYIPGSGSGHPEDTLRQKRLAGLSPVERAILEASGELDRKR